MPRLPVFLIVALVTTWLLAMHTVAEGLRVIDIVQSPLSEALAAFGGNDVGEAAQRAFVEGVSANSRIALPLGVAQFVLGTVLAVVSVRVLFWRRGSRTLLLQLVFANAVLAVIGYLVNDPVRSAVVEAIVVHLAKDRPAEIEPAEFVALARTSLQWGFRMWLAAQLVGFGFAGLVLTRRSVRDRFGRADGSAGDTR